MTMSTNHIRVIRHTTNRYNIHQVAWGSKVLVQIETFSAVLPFSNHVDQIWCDWFLEEEACKSGIELSPSHRARSQSVTLRTLKH